jgi:hypothetical protein
MWTSTAEQVGKLHYGVSNPGDSQTGSVGLCNGRIFLRSSSCNNDYIIKTRNLTFGLTNIFIPLGPLLQHIPLLYVDVSCSVTLLGSLGKQIK